MSTDKHPPPWTWEWEGGTDDTAVRLSDATGMNVLVPCEDDQPFLVCSQLAAELIRLAPELEAMLRAMTDEFRFEGDDETHEERVHPLVEEAEELLAALDAARKANQ